MLNRLLATLPRRAQAFVLAFLILVLTQILGQAGTRLVASVRPAARASDRGDAVVAFVVAVAGAGSLFLLGQAFPRPAALASLAEALLAVIVVVASSVFLGAIGAAVEEAVGPTVGPWIAVFAICAALWSWAALDRLPEVRRWFQAQVDRLPGDGEGHGEGHVVLVMLVSSIPEKSLEHCEPEPGATVTMTDPRTSGQVARWMGLQNLTEDIAALEGTRWPWQQLLRGLEPVVTRGNPADRTTIVLIGSAGETGSFRQLGKCVRLLREYPELRDDRRVEVLSSPAFLRESAAAAGLRLGPRHIADGGIDFEDFNAVRQHVFLVVHMAAARVGDDRVFVDVTGGQKTTSIAAAVATTGETGFCQYVQTNPPNRVRFYDLHPPEMPAI